MSDFAFVDLNNTVKTIIVADQTFIDLYGNQVALDQHLGEGQWFFIDATLNAIGDVYDPETQTFSKPVIEEPEPEPEQP
jgi:hypothetical protein